MIVLIILFLIITSILFVLWLKERNNKKHYISEIKDKNLTIKKQTDKIIDLQTATVKAQYHAEETLTENSKQLQKEVDNLTLKIDNLIRECDDIDTRRVSKIQMYDQMVDEYFVYQKNLEQIKEWETQLNKQLASNKTALKTLEESAQKLAEELSHLSAQHQEATKRLNDTNLGQVMCVNIQEKELLQILTKLKLNYPQLADSFNQIIWTKIWQPKFQAMTVDMLKKDPCGIYRIFTVAEDGTQRSYVGQAKHIRDRWSQHIKKMIGIDKADNVKFYSNITPEIAHFEVIEECADKDLNVKERYWIEYYNCIEFGYNSK